MESDRCYIGKSCVIKQIIILYLAVLHYYKQSIIKNVLEKYFIKKVELDKNEWFSLKTLNIPLILIILDNAKVI
jgi:hypothetical protein